MSRGLQIVNLRLDVELSGNDIVDEVNLSVQPGKVLGLVGESGSGKTTVGLAVLGHTRRGVRYHSGQVTIGETEVTSLSDEGRRQVRGRLVSYVPQDPASSLNPALRVGKQLMEVLEAHNFGGSDEARRDRVMELMGEVLLPRDEEFLRRYPHQLSGGQQQRIGLAMAFACRPSVIVLDEPTTGLDVSTQEHVLSTVRSLTREHGVAALYITHDLAVVADLADEVAVMYAGRVIETGSVREIFTAPAHPYTRHLVAAAPDIAGGKQMVGLVGRAPQPGKRPQGCAFALRCELAEDRCRESFPSVVQVGGVHTARCVRVGVVSTTTATASIVRGERTAGQPVLVATGVSAGYAGKTVVHDVDLTLRHGECLALVGESGSGKTTVSRAIGGLLREWSGSILMEGRELGRTSRKRSVEDRLGIQYVFQNPYGSLNPRRTVRDSIARPLLIGGMSSKDADEAVVDVLQMVSLPSSFGGKYPDQLSGGERQRVAIARAIVSKPTILLCDEVTSALDVLVQASIVDLLGRLRKELGLAMLFVTHNLPLVRSIADEVAVMSEGRIIEFGTAEEVIGSPREEYTKRLIAATPSIERSMA